MDANVPIRIANAPCSWGVLEFDLPGQAAGYAQVLDEIRDTGYAGTELGDWGFMPTNPAALRAEVDRRGLELLGAFVPVAFAHEHAHAAGEALAVQTAQLLAAAAGPAPFVVLADDNGKDPVRTRLAGRILPEHRLDDAQWATYARGVQRVAEAVRRTSGLRCVFHHHGAGYVETPWEIERLLSLTDPKLLGLCFDTGHFRFGGGDPLEGFRRFRDRIWYVHFKDCSPTARARAAQEGWDYFTALKHAVFCELGQGDVPFPALMDELKRTDYHGWIVVEQDVLPGMGAPKEFARRNRAYLRALGL